MNRSWGHNLYTAFVIDSPVTILIFSIDFSLGGLSKKVYEFS